MSPNLPPSSDLTDDLTSTRYHGLLRLIHYWDPDLTTTRDGAVRAGNLTDEQLKKIKSVDKVRKEQRRQTVEGDLASFSTLLVGGNNNAGVLEKAAKRSDIVQYILVLANDLINGTAPTSCLVQFS